MTTKGVSAGRTINYYNTGSAISADDVVVIAGLGCGVAATDIDATTGTGAVVVEGIFDLKRNSSDTFSVGQKVYWDVSAEEVINAAVDDDDVFLGYAAETVLSAAAGNVQVKLAPFSEQGARLITKATATTVTADDFAGGICTVTATAAGTQAVSLIAAASAPGAIFGLEKNGSAGAVTVTPTAGTIAGGATYTAVDADNDKAWFQAIGTDWVLITATLS